MSKSTTTDEGVSRRKILIGGADVWGSLWRNLKSSEKYKEQQQKWELTRKNMGKPEGNIALITGGNSGRWAWNEDGHFKHTRY